MPSFTHPNVREDDYPDNLTSFTPVITVTLADELIACEEEDFRRSTGDTTEIMVLAPGSNSSASNPAKDPNGADPSEGHKEEKKS